jgi:hypothetical protein
MRQFIRSPEIRDGFEAIRRAEMAIKNAKEILTGEREENMLRYKKRPGHEADSGFPTRKRPQRPFTINNAKRSTPREEAIPSIFNVVTIGPTGEALKEEKPKLVKRPYFDLEKYQKQAEESANRMKGSQ